MNVAKRIVQGVVLPSAAGAAQYTAPVNVRCLVKKVTFTNTSASVAVKVSVHLVPSAGAVSDANSVRKTRTLYPLEQWECYEAENHVLEPGDMLNAYADAAGVTMHASGVEMT